MAKRKTPEDLEREAAERNAKAARMRLLAQARQLLDVLKSDLRTAEKAGGDPERFRSAHATATALRSTVGELAGLPEADAGEQVENHDGGEDDCG